VLVTPVILASWEAETPISTGHGLEPGGRKEKEGEKLSVMAHVCHPIYRRKLKVGGLQARLAWAKSETLFSKQPEQKGLEA
jgi:hypothetical protein